MSLAVVSYNGLLLLRPQDKEARIFRQCKMADGAVMALLAPWWVY